MKEEVEEKKETYLEKKIYSFLYRISEIVGSKFEDFQYSFDSYLDKFNNAIFNAVYNSILITIIYTPVAFVFVPIVICGLIFPYPYLKTTIYLYKSHKLWISRLIAFLIQLGVLYFGYNWFQEISNQ